MAGKTLKASVIIGGSMSGSFRSAMSSTKNGLKAIGSEIARVERQQRLMASGIDTFARQGRSVDGLRRKYAGLAVGADRLRAAQSRLASVQSRIDANSARRSEFGGKLRGASTTFAAVAATAFFPVREAIKFENAMLGVARQVDGARDASGKLTSVYFDMAKQIQKLGHELPIANTGIADLVTAGARMGIARKDLIGFARNTAMMATAFEMPESEIGDSMGKIAGLFRIPIPAIGELGDAINQLDDKSQAKGSDIIRIMQGDLAGAAATMGLSAKNAAALASTFLTLGESAERADTAAAGMMRQLQVAKMNPKRYQIGVKMLGMSAEQLQKGMIDDPQAMILDVLGRIKKLPVEQQMEAVTRLFGKDWGGAIAKLANGVEEYRRQIELANGAAAKGTMSKEFQARMQTTSAQWQITKNRMSEAAGVIGNSLKPAINDLMQSAGPMIEGFAAWSREHPGAIKGIVGTAFALSGLRVATYAFGFALTSIKAPVLSVMGYIAKWRAAGAIASMNSVGPAAGRAAGGFRLVGAAVAALGFGLAPAALAVGTLVTGALVIRKYWEPISAWVGGVFEGIRESVGPAMSQIGAALAPLKPAWDAFAGAVGSVWNWFAKLVEPVRLTGEEFGKVTAAGKQFGSVVGGALSLVLGKLNDIAKVIGFVSEHWRAISGIGKMMMPGSMTQGMAQLGASIFGGDSAKPAARRRLPVVGTAKGKAPPASAPDWLVNPASGVAAARAGNGTAPTRQQVNNFQITQQPGESGEALADRIAKRLEQREAVNRRGSLVDAPA